MSGGTRTRPSARRLALVSSSPVISHLEWGVIDVVGVGRFRDVKLWPGGGRAWDWTENDTHHVPGIPIADVEELLEHGAEVVVLSRGVDRRLQVPDATVAFLSARGITVEVLQSEAAVRRYNTLASTQRVAALIHSTC
jgi:hypothetical protein